MQKDEVRLVVKFCPRPTDGHLVKAHVPQASETPAILQHLKRALLAPPRDVLGLAKDFPEDWAGLSVLNDILNMGTLVPDSISGVHFESEDGYSVHMRVRI